MNKVVFVIVTVLMSAALSLAVAAETPQNPDASESREPASSLETKKEFAKQGFPPSEEPPTRLFEGEWRKSMSNSGFDWNAFYFWNGVSNQNGGVQKGSVGNSAFDIYLHFDFEKMFGWKGGSFHLQHHTHGGELLGPYVGDAAGVNSYAPAGPNDSFLSQAYVQQAWSEGAGSLLFGLYDFSTEFFVTDSSLIFLNNGFLLGLEIYPPDPSVANLSIYPVNAPALRLKWTIDEAGYIMAGIASSTTRDPKYSTGTHPRMGKDEGYFQILEAGLQSEVSADVFNKLAIGAWNFTDDFNKNDGSGLGKYSGLYALVDHHLTSNLAVFVRYGMANKEVAWVSSTMSVGVNYTGVFTEDDQLGLGASQSNLSPDYIDAEKVLGNEHAANEQSYELVYRNEIMPGVVLTPDLQMIKSPSMSKEIKDATVASLRLELSF